MVNKMQHEKNKTYFCFHPSPNINRMKYLFYAVYDLNFQFELNCFMRSFNDVFTLFGSKKYFLRKTKNCLLEALSFKSIHLCIKPTTE